MFRGIGLVYYLLFGSNHVSGGNLHTYTTCTGLLVERVNSLS